MLGVILAAGSGTRLWPLSGMRPKAAIPTLDLPMLMWQATRLAQAGVDGILINAHHRASVIRALGARAAEELALPVEVVVEPMALGTAGALRNMADRLQHTFVLVNSDVVTDVPLDLLIEAHRSAQGAATLTAIPSDDHADLVVEQGWVTELIDRTTEPSPGWIYGGNAVFEPEVISMVPGGPSGLFETVMRGVLDAERGMAALTWEGYWCDTGTPDHYLKANLDALAGTVQPPTPAKGAYSETSFIGEGARVDVEAIRHSVIGHGAIVPPGTDLERCVVWDGTKVEPGSYRGAIIGDGCVVMTEP